MKKTLAVMMVVLAVPAVAQTEQEKKKAAPVQKLDFTEGSEIEGGAAVPLGHIYLVPPKRVFSNLIKVRMNFDDKLRESVHEM